MTKIQAIMKLMIICKFQVNFCNCTYDAVLHASFTIIILRHYVSVDESSLNDGDSAQTASSIPVSVQGIPLRHNLCYAAHFKDAHNRRITL